jgi:alpha-tubulin suppressor-like RCC1 family protein
VYCWGDNSLGQLGRTTDGDVGLPGEVEGLTSVKTLIAGPALTCAITEDGAMYCWGSNDFGERGDDAPDPGPDPHRLALEEVESAAAGTAVCATKKHGQVHCWGWNRFGQLGNGSIGSEPQPTPVALKPLDGRP